MQQTVGEQHTVARLGGDEFTVVLEDLEKPDDAERIAREIINAFEAPLLLRPTPTQIRVPVTPPAADATPDAKPGLAVERRFVKFGAAKDERIAIVSGLKEGEKVVTAGQIKLQNNSPVVIDESTALPLPAVTPKP